MFRHLIKGKTSGFLVLAVAAVAGTSAYAFTASNSGPAAHQAGVSNATVTGYTVTSVAYQYDPANGDTDGVTFDLENAAASAPAPATDVWATLLSQGNHGGTTDGSGGPLTAADWTDCGATVNGASDVVTCAFDGSTVVNTHTAHAEFTPAQHLALQIIAVSTGLVTLT